MDGMVGVWDVRMMTVAALAVRYRCILKLPSLTAMNHLDITISGVIASRRRFFTRKPLTNSWPKVCG
jgi:hypothetical protein